MAHLVVTKVTVKVVMLLMVRQIMKLEMLSLKVLNVCLHGNEGDFCRERGTDF